MITLAKKCPNCNTREVSSWHDWQRCQIAFMEKRIRSLRKALRVTLRRMPVGTDYNRIQDALRADDAQRRARAR